ncbi:MAG: motility protein A [Spirochaetia bacterium]|nr:motility protein A [Spirochaetia bacterium]
MDIASIIGLAGGLITVIIGIITSGLPFALIVDFASVVITFGGAFAALVMSVPMGQFLKTLVFFNQIFKKNPFNMGQQILQIVSFGEKARRDGLLALEDEIEGIKEAFFKKSLQLVVDGTDPELVRNIMDIEVESLSARHGDNRKVFDILANMGPSFGMLGTLIGLVAMLQNLGAGDPAMIGKGMGIALITSLYGSFLANVIAIPTANKLKAKTDEELTLKQIMLEGVLSIQAGDNPRVISEKLRGYISPEEQKGLQELEKD